MHDAEHLDPDRFTRVWESSTGKLWEVILHRSFRGRLQFVLWRFGEIPGTAGGWKGLTRYADEMSGWTPRRNLDRFSRARRPRA